ncbi:hypothetical protein D3C72_1477270 [compost metagenome]
MIGQGLPQSPDPHIGRGQKQPEQSSPAQQRRYYQQQALPSLHQHQQRAELEQQHQHQRHHGNRPTARVFHDFQGTFAVTEAAQPGIGTVGQAIQVQTATEQNPGTKQQGGMQQQRTAVEQGIQAPQQYAKQQPHQRIEQQRAAQLLRCRHPRQTHRQAAEKLQGNPEREHLSALPADCRQPAPQGGTRRHDRLRPAVTAREAGPWPAPATNA